MEDQLACLTRVRRHLAPGGLLAFDVFNPRLDRIARCEEPWAEDLRFDGQDGEEVVRRVRVVERDHAAQLQRIEMRYERRRGERVVGADVARLRIRWFHRFELEHLLERAGFGGVEIRGDFDGSPLRPDSPAYVVTARC